MMMIAGGKATSEVFKAEANKARDAFVDTMVHNKPLQEALGIAGNVDAKALAGESRKSMDRVMKLYATVEEALVDH